MQGKRIAGYTTAGNDVAKNECDSISINANIHRQNAGKAYARCSLPAFSINAKRGCSANRGLLQTQDMQKERAGHVSKPRGRGISRNRHFCEICGAINISTPRNVVSATRLLARAKHVLKYSQSQDRLSLPHHKAAFACSLTCGSGSSDAA